MFDACKTHNHLMCYSKDKRDRNGEKRQERKRNWEGEMIPQQSKQPLKYLSRKSPDILLGKTIVKKNKKSLR